jgi:predicted house-cleaning noncanonical NTP pyrophosphatase (MazG superfamily)
MKLEKLVRRHVPDQLRARGERVETRIAKPDEMLGLLRDKLKEEIDELFEALDMEAAARKEDTDPVVEELADVMESIAALEAHLGASTVIRASVRKSEKREEKGRFTNIVMALDAPEPLILHCPKCGTKHVDKGIWGTTRIHRTHLCSGCGELWKPFAHATVGVEDVAVYKLAGAIVPVAEVQAFLRERTDALKVKVKVEMFAFFDRLRKTIALNRGQSAEVLANSVLAHLDQESTE